MKKKIKQAANTVNNLGSNSVKVVDAAASAVNNLTKGKVISAANSVIKTAGRATKTIHDFGKDIKKLLNHKEWYTRVGTAGLVGINISSRKGVVTDYLPDGISGLTSVPYMATLWLTLTKPIGDQGAFDQAVTFMYSSIRKANSGSVNYTEKDLCKYILTVRSLRACIADAIRSYGLLNSLDYYDSTSPSGYFTALGKDYESFAANAANLEYFGNKLNLIAERLMPMNVTLFNRTEWLFKNMFKDSNDAKASMIAFKSYNVPIFNTKNDAVKLVQLCTATPPSGLGGIAYDTYVANIDDAFNDFRQDNKYQIIAGDILKAFGASSIYTATPFDHKYTTTPVFDESVMNQIQNIVLNPSFGTETSTAEWTFTGSTVGYSLVVKNEIASGGIESRYKELPKYLQHPVFNTYKDSLDIGDVLAYTRLMKTFDTIVDPDDDNTFISTATSLGTEHVPNFEVYYVTSGSARYPGNIEKTGVTLTNESFKVASVWSVIDYMPFIYGIENNELVSFMFDFNNYGHIDYKLLGSYTAYAVMSMLDAPAVYKTNKTEVIG